MIRILALVFAGLLLLLSLTALYMVWMPGTSQKEPLPALSEAESVMAEKLERYVHHLASSIGERNIFNPGTMDSTVKWIDEQFEQAGYEVRHHEYKMTEQFPIERYRGETYVNIVAERRGTERPEEVLLLGAHYDSVEGSPGANDNASGLATMLVVAEALADHNPQITIRFVAFANEEPPFFQSGEMGSYAYASQLSEGDEQIKGMISLDGLGYFSDDPESQEYPVPGINWIYPEKGNFIALVTRTSDAGFLRDVIGAFREEATIPSEGAALPGGLPGIGWSDHWSFWQHGFPAMLFTDTLPFRDPHYHTSLDLPERLDYERMARIANGLTHMMKILGGTT